MKKDFFTRVLLFFTGKTNIQKFQMGTTTGRLREPVTGYPEDQMIGRSGNVRETCVIDVFF